MNKKHLLKFGSKLRNAVKSNAGRVAAATTAMVAPFAAFAGASSTGQVIAGEIAGGSTEMGYVYGALAILVGLAVLWAFTRKAAGK